MNSTEIHCDVLIVGGGPAGSTTASLLKKYNPELRVAILEREEFPRDHVGESQLPAVCSILDEIGVWDKVEQAGFPIKIGSTYRWGSSDQLWNLNFLSREFTETERPGSFQGQRSQTAFQVDRSIYDKILLDHAESLGCEVYQPAKATSIIAEGNRISKVVAELQEGAAEFSARFYVDGSGDSCLFHRFLDIEKDSPTLLKNIAFWDYWQNAEWAETVGNGGTRVQVMSLGWGWIWFIPITETRTSVGLVLPSDHYKKSGKRPEEIYREAISVEPLIRELVSKATCENKFETTKDWNFVSDHLTGENWFLIGDSCGFADPILAAGMTLAQVSARKVAYTILEIDRGIAPAHWLREEYERRHTQNIRHHIKFAEFWYSANGHFTDLREYCTTIAKSAGIDLSPEAAFQWLGTGGFASDIIVEDRSTAFGFLSAKAVVGRFVDSVSEWEVSKNNRFVLNLEGSHAAPFAVYQKGRVYPAKSYQKADKTLPLMGHVQLIFQCLTRESDATALSKMFWKYLSANATEFPDPKSGYRAIFEVMEALISDGWIQASVDPKMPFLQLRREE